MDKSFRSLARDPWNKLKVYFCLRMIEVEHESDRRAQLLVELADARKRMDPALALTLCEAALRLSPQDSVVLRQVRNLLATMASDSTSVGRHDVTGPAAKISDGPDTRTSGGAARGGRPETRLLRQKEEEPRRREEEELRRREEEELRRREEEELRRREEEELRRREEEELRRREEEELRRREEEERRRREREVSLRAEIRSLGYAAYLRKHLLAQGADPSVLATLEGFQPNPRGMVQFLELLRLKKALAEPAWLECLRRLEEAVVLADPRDPALEALRALAASQS